MKCGIAVCHVRIRLLSKQSRCQFCLAGVSVRYMNFSELMPNLYEMHMNILGQVFVSSVYLKCLSMFVCLACLSVWLSLYAYCHLSS